MKPNSATNATVQPTALRVGLKEWAVVCMALAQGHQAVLLRKGGIYEAAGEFELEHSAFLLLPTYLHQNVESVKVPWQNHIQKVAAEPDRILAKAWAKVHQIYRVPSRTALETLQDIYLWNKPLLDMRFGYRPDYPLYLILIETFLLANPIEILNHTDYASCKSWVPLKSEVDICGSLPVLELPQIQRLSERIEAAFANHPIPQK